MNTYLVKIIIYPLYLEGETHWHLVKANSSVLAEKKTLNFYKDKYKDNFIYKNYNFDIEIMENIE